MADMNFQPIIDYMDERFNKVEARLDQLDQKFDVMQKSVDNLTKMVKDFRDEHIVMHRRLESLEKWAKEVSDKLGIPLPSKF